jgi:hypothetical protein
VLRRHGDLVKRRWTIGIAGSADAARRRSQGPAAILTFFGAIASVA